MDGISSQLLQQDITSLGGIDVGTLPSPSMTSAAMDEGPCGPTSSTKVRPPSTFGDEMGTDNQTPQPFKQLDDVYSGIGIQPDTTVAAAAADDAAMTSRRTRCSCDVGCPCCGSCVQPSSSSSSSSTVYPALPASSVAALRDVDAFIAMYVVSPPPPLLPSPTADRFHATASVSPSCTMPLDSSEPELRSRISTTEDSPLLGQPVTNTVVEFSDFQSNLDTDNSLQQRNDESIDKLDFNTAVDLTTKSPVCSNLPDVLGYSDIHYPTAGDGAATCNETPFEQSSWHSQSPEIASENSVYCPATVNVSQQSLQVEDHSFAVSAEANNSDVNSFSANIPASEHLSAEHAVDSQVVESDKNVYSTDSDDALKPRVPTLAQQLEAYWNQRGKLPGISQFSPSTFRPDKAGTATARLRPRAPPPAPPCFTGVDVDPLSAECDEQLRATQTLPRAAASRSGRAAPPRPPPRATTPESSNDIPTSSLVRSAMHGSSQTVDMLMTLDRISLCQGLGSLKDSGALSSSVQSLPSFDATASGTSAASTTATTPRGKPAPQPPRRGSSMSPRLQTKSMRYGGGAGRTRSASLRAGDDDVDADVLLLGRSSRLITGCSSSSTTVAGGQQMDPSATTLPTTNRASRDVVRQTAAVPTQKPVAQIRPHAIRSPSASSFTRHRIDDDDEIKPNASPAQCYPGHQSPVRTCAPPELCSETQSFSFAGVDAASSSDRHGPTSAAASTSVSRFGTIRSKIRDYMTAATSSTGRSKQQITSSSSSSFADWTLPRGRRTGVARRSSSATSWEPDRDDYESSTADSSAPWSPSSYFGVTSGPRPFSSPRTRATEVSLPQNIIASAADSSVCTDVTSSISSRISTFLTFIGGSRRPTMTSPTSDVRPSTSSTTLLQSGPVSTALDKDNPAPERPLTNAVGGTRTATARAVVDPIVSTLDRRPRVTSSTPPVRSSSSSEALTVAATSAVCNVRGRQPVRFVREQRTSMSTFRNSGSLNVSVARSSSFSPYSTSDVERCRQTQDEFQTAGTRRRPLNSKTFHQTQIAGSTNQSSAVHHSAPSTPLYWHGEAEPLQSMSSSLPVDNSDRQTPPVDQTVVDAEDRNTEKTDIVTSPRPGPTGSVPQSVFRQVDVEVERLIELLQTAIPPDGNQVDRGGANVDAAREALLALTRQFVDDCQRLVSGATRSVNALVAEVDPSLATLKRLSAECRSTAAMLSSPSQGVMLVGRVRDLAQAYRATVSAARSAVGRPFNSVEMKSLMRQATSLAALLSSLIKMLNRTDVIC